MYRRLHEEQTAPPHPKPVARRGLGAPRNVLVALVSVLLTALSLGAPLALGADNQHPAAAAAEQVLTWTADNGYMQYRSVPTTAVAGPATIVFENSAATGNTTGLPHTLTFDTSDPDYNSDVSLNIMAYPQDDTGGRHTAEVTLTEGRYHYFCSMPGHSMMSGVLVVTAAGGGDTTAPEASASVTGDRNPAGDYVGSATVSITATDADSGVGTIEYALDNTAYTTYTGPITVNTPGQHTVKYRATDKAGNTSAEKTTTFTVTQPPAQDTTPPTTSATITGQQNPDGTYIGSATITITATDTESGLASIQYAVDNAPYTVYSGPVTVNTTGSHTLKYRATDLAGNASAEKTVTFTLVEEPPQTSCPEADTRPTVFIGTVDTGIPNRVTKDGCTINEVIEDEHKWENHGKFVEHVTHVTKTLLETGVITKDEQQQIVTAASQSEIGKPQQDRGYQSLFDGSQVSFANWEHVGGGDFTLNSDGSMTSSTSKPGLGMLWYPVKEYGDFSLKLKFRDDAPGAGNANSGVLVRFPDVHNNANESRPEWVAIKYGHEVQILDSPSGDQYKTGSVYGFDKVDIAGAGVTAKGGWNDYEIRVVGQHYSVYRNGVLINQFDNNPGQVFSPLRADDPGTSGRQLARGYIGLQNHSTADVISIKDVQIKEL